MEIIGGILALIIVGLMMYGPIKLGWWGYKRYRSGGALGVVLGPGVDPLTQAQQDRAVTMQTIDTYRNPTVENAQVLANQEREAALRRAQSLSARNDEWV